MRRATVRVFASSAVAVGCLVGCATPPPISRLGFPNPAAPPPAVKATRVVTDVVVNACNRETVHLTGELREETKAKDSRVEQHIKAHLTGHGDLGHDYQFELDVESKWDTASMNMTIKDRQLLSSTGHVPDLRVTVTISSSPLSLKLEAECHGGSKP
jgi:hypothetical protein